jgi:hypothetical protein
MPSESARQHDSPQSGLDDLLQHFFLAELPQSWAQLLTPAAAGRHSWEPALMSFLASLNDAELLLFHDGLRDLVERFEATRCVEESLEESGLLPSEVC